MNDYRWLIGDAATPWLALAADESRSLVARASRLRQSLSAAQARLVLEQVELRRRAVEKFPNSARMFFTRKGLEQATDSWVAAYKAARFPAGAAVDRSLLRHRRRPAGAGLPRADRGSRSRPGRCAAGRGQPAGVGPIGSRDRRRGTHRGCCAKFPFAEFAAWHIDPDRRPERTPHDSCRVLRSGPGGDCPVAFAVAGCGREIGAGGGDSATFGALRWRRNGLAATGNVGS